MVETMMERSLQDAPEDLFPLFVFGSVFLIVIYACRYLVWYVFYRSCVRRKAIVVHPCHSSNRLVFTTTSYSSNREDAAVMEARRREAARLAALANTAARIGGNDQQHFHTTQELVDGMNAADRKAFVANFLRTEIMSQERIANMTEESIRKEDGANTNTTATPTSGGATGSMVSDSSGIVSSLRDVSFLSTSRAKGPDCAICLERLRVGEEIGMAQNLACCHVYHKECISEWLMHHKDCPLCKQEYLGLEC